MTLFPLPPPCGGTQLTTMSLSKHTIRRINRRTRNDPCEPYDRPATALDIEALALPDEEPGRLSALLQELLDQWRPATRTAQALVEQLTIATIEKQRLVRARTAILAEQVRTAEYRFDQAADIEVESYVELLPSQPARALAGLMRRAAGLRWLIGRWQRLETILSVQETWYGQDRDEATLLQGSRPGLENLSASETAYLTHLYCLCAQPSPKPADINDLANPAVKPAAMRDHDPDDWAPSPRKCRQLLVDLAAGTLARLRLRAEYLRVHVEEPARAVAREQARVLSGKELALLTAERHHDQMFHRAERALNQRRRGRQRSSARGGFCPGSPRPGLIDTPLPPGQCADDAVLDFHSAHRAVLETSP